MSPSPRTLADHRRELAKMEARADRAESDAEYEACRQVIIYLRAQIEDLQSKSWRAA
jgi:hypothetical protein